MTLAEQFNKEGFQKGMQQGVRNGLLKGVELAVTLKFETGLETDKLIELLKTTADIHQLKAVKNAIMKINSIPELIAVLSD